MPEFINLTTLIYLPPAFRRFVLAFFLIQSSKQYSNSGPARASCTPLHALPTNLKAVFRNNESATKPMGYSAQWSRIELQVLSFEKDHSTSDASPRGQTSRVLLLPLKMSDRFEVLQTLFNKCSSSFQRANHFILPSKTGGMSLGEHTISPVTK